MDASRSTNGFSNPCVKSNPIIKAPQALKGIKIDVGAELESAIYANFSLGIFNLSKTGRNKVPTVNELMVVSTNNKTPVISAKSCMITRL